MPRGNADSKNVRRDGWTVDAEGRSRVPRVVASPRRRPVFSGARRTQRSSPPPRARRRCRARRPPTRVVPLPHRGRRQRATATTKKCKRREGDDDARGGGKVHGHDARVGTMRGLTRVGRRRGAQPLTQCAPPSAISLRVQ